ncbi:late competence protein ComER [Salipaludibacillus daqingensis]|uniref:late competence protein ComER n=1 Tax=Salipaludibacillus daqingensis TaxID=3041001 RepID=UPI0024740456|nr:late competence protein ComER [Salipaludibacillus daqingensis]
MKELGFIGTGNMGSLIIEAMIRGKKIPSKNIHMTNRTLEKAKNIQKRYPKTSVYKNSLDIVKHSDWVFICSKPLEMVAIIDEISNHLEPRHVIITITSPMEVEDTEQLVPTTPVVRFVPSIVNLALEGPSLITFSNRCSTTLRDELWELFSSISSPIIINNSITRVASDLASCGPAFLSFLVESMIKGAVDETEIDEKTATNITESMIIGYGELLRQKHFSLATLRERVTVAGGVTGIGLNVLQKEVGFMFHELYQETAKKYKEDRRGISNQLQKKKS